MIYLLVLILLLIPVVKYDLMAKTGGENKWYYFNMVVLILLAGLRYRVGGDTLFYMVMFEDYPNLAELKYFDFDEAEYQPLWYFFNAVSRSIYDNFTFFQIMHAVFVNSVFFWFFRRYCPSYYFSVILIYYVRYFVYFNMEVLRESLCICLLLLSIPLFIKRKWLLYYLVCIIALMFHYSSLIMFLFPFLLIFKKESWKLQVFILVAVLMFTSVANAPLMLLSLLSSDENILLLAEKYLINERNMMGMLSCLIQYLPLLGIIYLRQRYEVKTSFSLTPFVVGAVVVYAFSINLPGVERLVNYFIPFILVYIVDTAYYIISNVKLRFTLGYSVFFASFLLLGFNYYYYYAKDHSDVYPNTRFYSIFYPYHSVFTKKQDEHRERFIENFRETVINL